jgi:hypothetical protein
VASSSSLATQLKVPPRPKLRLDGRHLRLNSFRLPRTQGRQSRCSNRSICAGVVHEGPGLVELGYEMQEESVIERRTSGRDLGVKEHWKAAENTCIPS